MLFARKGIFPLSCMSRVYCLPASQEKVTTGRVRVIAVSTPLAFCAMTNVEAGSVTCWRCPLLRCDCDWVPVAQFFGTAIVIGVLMNVTDKDFLRPERGAARGGEG